MQMSEKKNTSLTHYRNHVHLIYNRQIPDPSSLTLFWHSCPTVFPSQIEYIKHLENKHGITFKIASFENQMLLFTYKFKSPLIKKRMYLIEERTGLTEKRTDFNFKRKLPKRENKNLNLLARKKFTHTSFLQKSKR